MAKQYELYGMGYKKGIQDCWKEVLRYLVEANKQGAIRFEDMAVLTLQHYLKMYKCETLFINVCAHSFYIINPQSM